VTNGYLIVVIAALVIFIVAVSMLKIGKGGAITAEPLMTDIERQTIVYLELTVPHCRVHAQVSMGALLRPIKGLSQKNSAKTRNRFSQKIVDYVLEDRETGEVVAIVELDDRTHDKTKDRERDAMTKAAGYLTIRLPANERPTRKNVGNRVVEALEKRQAAAKLI